MSSFSMIEVLFLAANGPRGFREFGLFGCNRRSRLRPPSLTAPLPERVSRERYTPVPDSKTPHNL